MAVSIAGIIINIIMLLIIIGLIITGVVFNGEAKTCENSQSPFCYTITCPCDNTTQGPCFGYAKSPGPQSGQWYCSNAPLTLVDDDGNIL